MIRKYKCEMFVLGYYAITVGVIRVKLSLKVMYLHSCSRKIKSVAGLQGAASTSCMVLRCVSTVSVCKW